MTRSRLLFYLLLLTPLLVYWPTIFHDYGWRDDYSYLREAREEPGKILAGTSSHGRPLYGALLETSFEQVGQVESLVWVRLLTVLLLTALALALWQQLLRSGWNEAEAAAIGLGLVLLPAAQVISGWATSWPCVVALLLALAGFSAIETELGFGGLKRIIALIGGALIYALAGLIYPSNAMFAVVPIAAVLLVRSPRDTISPMRWLVVHLSALFLGLLGSYVLVKLSFASGLFDASPRIQFETNPFTKLIWFLGNPLPNSAALIALRDSFGEGATLFWLTALLVLGMIAFAWKLLPNPGSKRSWLICVAGLPFVAHAVSLLAAERVIGYRVLFALSGLVLVLLVFTFRLLRESNRLHRNAEHGILAVLVLLALLAARKNAVTLIAEPQGHEWTIARHAVQRNAFKGATKVYLIRASLADRSTARVFADEFGSLSSSSDWAPREMFKAALYDRFGGLLPKGVTVDITVGETPPAPGAFDVVVDFRQLKARRVD